MASTHDLDRLKLRVRRLCRETAPPDLGLAIWNEGEEPPPFTDWQLRILVEDAHSWTKRHS